MGMINKAGVIFRRVGQRVIPIYLKHQKAADIALAAGTVIGASVAAEKSRNFVAGKVYYKGRKGFNNGLVNFAWDTGVTSAITYGVSRKAPGVARGLSSIHKFIRSQMGGHF